MFSALLLSFFDSGFLFFALMPSCQPKLEERRRIVCLRVRPEPHALEHCSGEVVTSHFRLIFASSPHFSAVSRLSIPHENVYNACVEHFIITLNFKKETQSQDIDISRRRLENIQIPLDFCISHLVLPCHQSASQPACDPQKFRRGTQPKALICTNKINPLTPFANKPHWAIEPIFSYLTCFRHPAGRTIPSLLCQNGALDASLAVIAVSR